MVISFILYAVVMIFGIVNAITLKQECTTDEIHRSCSLHKEYTCWMSADRLTRVKELPKRLNHCTTGCYCKKGLVRDFPQGRCIATAGCRDRKLQAVLKRIPTSDIWTL